MKGQPIDVHFNPVSLQHTISNSMKEEGKGNAKKQFVSQSTAKLTMDLVFDTTADGQDVRTYTVKIAQLMEPDEKKVPAIVKFEWGTYTFQGVVDSFKETIDFFAPTGVPLRASVSIALSRQDKVFEPGKPSKFDTQGSLDAEPVEVPSGALDDATTTAASGGDPAAGRQIAAFNGLESMRFTAGAALTVSASVKLSPPVAFATGGAGAGFGIGGGIGGGIGAGIGGGISGGVSGGIGVSGSVGAGVSAGAGFGIGGGISAGGGAGFSAGAGFGVTAGGAASARVSATAGAFSGLRASANGRLSSPTLDVRRLIKPGESVTVATDSGASFAVGGKASIEGSTSLSADVGASASLRSRIQFEED
jgi:hypothetical protein